MTVVPTGDRLVLPVTETLEDVEIFAGAVGFKQGHQKRTEHVFEKVWVVSGDLYFHYVDNVEFHNAYVQLTGGSPERIEQFTGFARTFFTAVDVDTLISQVRDARTHQELGTALTRLGTGMTADAPPEALRLIHDGFASPEPVVRRGALLCALYLEWPAVRTQVTHMAEHDDVARLRHEAAYFLQLPPACGLHSGG